MTVDRPTLVQLAPTIGRWWGRPVLRSRWLSWITHGELVVFALAFMVYLVSRLVGLTRFPIYFFCDEATHANLAEQLLRNHFSIDGTFLPPFLRNDQRWNLSLSVYLHVLPVALFGKSIFVTRATSLFFSSLGVAAVAVLLKSVFRARLWWASVLLCGVTPVWFLHTRTAFEPVMMVSFYGCFLAAYLAYRTISPRYLLAAIVFGGATFYAYTNGQGVMAATGALLLLLDLPYHLRQLRASPRLATAAVALFTLVAVPYLRFRLLHPNAVKVELATLNSYWLTRIPLKEKLTVYLGYYAHALSPAYWFVWHASEPIRHVIKGMGYLPWLMAPLIAVGLAAALWKGRSSPAYRVVLASVLAAPFSSALVEIHVLRIFALVVPAVILASLGLEIIAQALARVVPLRVLGFIAGVLLSLQLCRLTATSLRDGATWFSDYTLYGMQWGARQVFSRVDQQLSASKNLSFRISTSWANYPNAFVLFFVPVALRDRVEFFALDQILRVKGDLGSSVIYVLTAAEQEHALSSGKLWVDVHEILPYPDGRPGFYFDHLRYVEGVEAIMEEERHARQVLVQEQVTIEGQPAVVRHSRLDLGDIANIFDGNIDTLARGEEANPFVLELDFPQPRPVHLVSLDLWSKDFTITVSALEHGETIPRTLTKTYRNVPPIPHVELLLPSILKPVGHLRIEIRNDFETDPTHVHIREIRLR